MFLNDSISIELLSLMVLLIVSISVLLVLLHIKKEKHNKLYVDHYFYELVLGKTQDVIFVWDYESNSISFSGNYKNITGNKENVMLFPQSLMGSGYIHSEDEEVLNSIFSEKDEKESRIREVRFKNRYGEYNWCSIDYSKLYDNRGKLIKIVGMISNIEKEKQKLFEIQNQAMCDSMTSLYNRRTTENLIEAYLKRGENSFGIMILLDIDNFKMINDSRGHAKGDVVIIKMSEVLRTFFRKNDIIGRIGGDEFLVFLTGLNSDYNVRKRATELLVLLNQTFQAIEDLDCVSCSLGISSYPYSGSSFQELYEAADLLLYKAKNKGKNTYVAWKD